MLLLICLGRFSVFSKSKVEFTRCYSYYIIILDFFTFTKLLQISGCISTFISLMFLFHHLAHSKNSVSSLSNLLRMIFAGLPATIGYGLTLFATMSFIPMIAPSPTRIPGSIIAFCPYGITFKGHLRERHSFSIKAITSQKTETSKQRPFSGLRH